MNNPNDPNNAGGMPVPPQHQQPAAPQQGGTNLPAGLVAFGSYDQQQAEQDAKEAEKYGGGSDWYNLKDGPNVLRILPPKPGGKSPFMVRFRHWLDLPNGESVKFNCPQKMAGQYCPICERADQLKKSADRNERDQGFSLSPQRQAIAVVIDRTDPDKGPLACQLPGKTVYDPLVNMRNDSRGGGDYTHPINGFDVIIKRSGKGKKGTKYEVLPDRNNSQLAESIEQMNEWIMGQPDIATFCAIPTAQEISDMIAEATGQGGNRSQQMQAPAPAPAIGGQPQGYPQQGQPIPTTARPQTGGHQQVPQQPQQYPPQGYPPQGGGGYPPQASYQQPPQQRAESEIHQGPGGYDPDDNIPF